MAFTSTMGTIISLCLAFIALLVTIYGIAYYYLSTRHKERMALIEAGMDPSTFTHSKRISTFILMLAVILTIGITPAMVIASLYEIKGYLLSEFPHMYLVTFFLFTGLSLFICYFIIKKNSNKERK
jgi:hypothetical protein